MAHVNVHLLQLQAGRRDGVAFRVQWHLRRNVVVGAGWGLKDTAGLWGCHLVVVGGVGEEGRRLGDGEGKEQGDKAGQTFMWVSCRAHVGTGRRKGRQRLGEWRGRCLLWNALTSRVSRASIEKDRRSARAPSRVSLFVRWCLSSESASECPVSNLLHTDLDPAATGSTTFASGRPFCAPVEQPRLAVC